tara:strand:- start:4490 stop:4726 length:237 start_codon:yes stop_codon:yes gene_type:complete
MIMLVFEYSTDKGQNWTRVTPEGNTHNDRLQLGENELKINTTSKHIMFRLATEATMGGQDPYCEISDINIIYRKKNLK